VPFHVTLTGTSGVCAGTLAPGTDYLAPLLARFVEACDRGHAPDGPQALLSPIAVLESVTRALPGASGRN
jgi:hypothetical protein